MTAEGARDTTDEQPREDAATGNGDRVLIFDTTLRDGEQSPGASLELAAKLDIARALAALRVDVLEAGFPAASPGDFAAVREIAARIDQGPTPPIICGLARAQAGDIECAAQALAPALAEGRGRIHVFLATSPIHREWKLRLSKDEVVAQAAEGVARARELADDVEFSAEDAARTEPDFLAEVFERVIAAGASTVNVPDTVGYAVPEQFGEKIRFLKRTVRGIENVRIAVHCHDDLGLAVANTLAGLAAGARQVECTINGLGERAGNCPLEEVVMALAVRRDAFGLHTGIDSRRLVPTSRLVSALTGMVVQRNKAIVGRNAFAHEAGIHQHGMLRHRETYEILRPEDVGREGTDLVLGKHSGRHALRERFQALGYEIDEARLDRLFVAFKTLADTRKEILDADLERLITEESDAIRAARKTGTTHDVIAAEVAQ